jgi:hypothetical protein
VRGLLGRRWWGGLGGEVARPLPSCPDVRAGVEFLPRSILDTQDRTRRKGRGGEVPGSV